MNKINERLKIPMAPNERTIVSGVSTHEALHIPRKACFPDPCIAKIREMRMQNRNQHKVQFYKL